MTQRYKAIFFDLDGTLRISTPSPIDAFIQFARSRQIVIDSAAVRRVKIWAHQYWGQGEFLIREVDRLGEDAFWINYSRQLLETVEASNDLDNLARQVRDYFSSGYAPKITLAADAAALLASLKEAGYVLGIISNRSRPFHDVLEQLGIADWFDTTLAAGEIGFWKPNAAIFHHALSRFDGLAAAECMYVGDNYYADALGASRAGMTPVMYDPEGLYGDLETICTETLPGITAVLAVLNHPIIQ